MSDPYVWLLLLTCFVIVLVDIYRNSSHLVQLVGCTTLGTRSPWETQRPLLFWMLISCVTLLFVNLLNFTRSIWESILFLQQRQELLIFYTIVFAILFIKTPLGSLCILWKYMDDVQTWSRTCGNNKEICYEP